MAQLLLTIEGRDPRVFVLTRSTTAIGRSQENDIVINNLALSRRHAEVQYRDGAYFIVDLKSQNGVYVNQQRLEAPRRLEDEDVIVLGTHTFVFRSSNLAAVDEQDEDIAGAPLLILRFNEVELLRNPLGHEPCVIGRAKECQIQIPERRLSRKHCEIRMEDRSVVVRDLQSQNGTYVNRKRIEGAQALRHGDVLNFAEHSVLFLADERTYVSPDEKGAVVAAPRPSEGSMINGATLLPPVYKPPAMPPVSDPSAKAIPVLATSRESRESVVSAPSGDPLTRRPNDVRAERQRRIPRSIEERNRPVDDTRPPRDARAKSDGTPLTVQPKAASLPPDKHPSSEHAGRTKSLRAETTTPRKDLEAVQSVDPLADDADLVDWYRARDEKSELFDAPSEAIAISSHGSKESDADDDDEPSLASARSHSSVSHVLATMMVNVRELDKNLKSAPNVRRRKFRVHVAHKDKIIFEGPIDRDVTIMGTDKDSEIKLKGRYVGARHSLLVRVRDSLLLVRLGSSSAARVNGLPKLQAFLKNGDTIQIDETLITISEDV